MALSAAVGADIGSFCFGAPTVEQKDTWNAVCPGYIAAQAQAATLSLQSSQQQLAKAYQEMIKAPPSQIGDKVDIGSLAAGGKLKDAQSTYAIARTIGEQVIRKADPTLADPSKSETKTVAAATGASKAPTPKRILILAPEDRAALFATPIDASVLAATLDELTKRVKELKCPAVVKPSPTPGEEFRTFSLPIGPVAEAGALVSLIGTVLSALQPTLVSAAATTPIASPQFLMVAGVSRAAIDLGRPWITIATPSVTPKNKVVAALNGLRDAVTNANHELAGCAKDDDTVKKANAVFSDVTAYVNSVTKTDGAKPSVLDAAARRAALDESDIEYLLVLSRDVAAGGIAAVKPNWFQSTKILMASVDGVSYQLTSKDGTVQLAGFEYGTPWVDRCDIDDWEKSFTGCSTTNK